MDITTLSTRARMGKVSRREFIALGVVGGMSVGAADALFVSVARATPKKGGTFRLGTSGLNTTDSHDPATFGTGASQTIGLWGSVYNNLTEIAPNGELVGELAESWEPSGDAKVWTFKLREDIEFHNGKTLDAGDVVASFNHHRGPDTKSAAKAIVDPIVDIRSDGKDTVVIELAQGNADLPYLCTDYHLVIGPAQDGTIDWEAAIGTGGYTLASHERGIRMTLERNPNYWKEDRAHFDEALLLGINDITARMNALITDEVDAIRDVDLKTVHLLERNTAVAIEEVTGTQHFTMPMFTDTPPFDDNNVRLALKHAIDRKAVIQTVLRGHGVPGNDHPITPANRYYASDLPVREYDPDKAKYHLKQAGLGSLKVDLSAADAAFLGAVDTAILFREHAAKAGIDVNVVREPNDGYWTNVWTKKPFVMCYWGGRPTEDWMFSLVYAADAPWNDTHWKNERFDKLLLEARTELDDDKRRALYREAQLIVRDDGGVIVPMYANYVFARSAKVARGDAIGSNWELDGWKCIERWWFA